MTTRTYASEQKKLAAAWKKRTRDLPDRAREPAPWIDQDGCPVGRYDHCLPAGFAHHNLLPESSSAITLFQGLGIEWHCGIEDGPGNNLLSSQVQCVNALMPMVGDPNRLKRTFGGAVDVAEVLQIEPGRYLTFEYIGPIDYFDEGVGRPRSRGSRCTSLDAAFLYRTSQGVTELALIEWKYTEQYTVLRAPAPRYDTTRTRRYATDYRDSSGPLRFDLLEFQWMLDEPFYQLMRQQLLAWRLEQDRAEGAEIVRVLHVLPPANRAYQASLVRREHRALGATVDEVWRQLLRRPDRFRHIDPAVFLDENVTSGSYVDRYAPAPLS